MIRRQYNWFRPMVPCTLIGVLIGGLAPLNLNGNDASYVANELLGAIVGCGFGFFLDKLVHYRNDDVTTD